MKRLSLHGTAWAMIDLEGGEEPTEALLEVIAVTERGSLLRYWNDEWKIEVHEGDEGDWKALRLTQDAEARGMKLAFDPVPFTLPPGDRSHMSLAGVAMEELSRFAMAHLPTRPRDEHDEPQYEYDEYGEPIVDPDDEPDDSDVYDYRIVEALGTARRFSEHADSWVDGAGV